MATNYFSDMGAILSGNADSSQWGGGITGSVGLGGLALEGFGAMGEMSAAKTEANISMQEAGTEMQMNEVRRQMMTVDFHRRQTQAIRESEAARATGRAAAVNQGGSVMGTQAGSGYSGGQAQATAQGAYTIQQLGLDYNLGNQMFDLTNQLDQEKIKMAQAQSDAATSQGWASLGGAAVSAAGMLGKLAMM